LREEGAERNQQEGEWLRTLSTDERGKGIEPNGRAKPMSVTKGGKVEERKSSEENTRARRRGGSAWEF